MSTAFRGLAGLAVLGTVTLLRGKLSEPGQNRFRAYDQAAGSALLGRELLALAYKASPLFGGEADPGRAGRRPQRLLENQDLLQ